MKNACAASRSLLLWFQGPAYSQPPGQGMLIKAHYTIGCNQSTVQLISWVPWLSIACQQNHNEIFPFVIPENQRRWRFLLAKRAAVTRMFCVCLSLPLQVPYCEQECDRAPVAVQCLSQQHVLICTEVEKFCITKDSFGRALCHFQRSAWTS